MSTDSTVQEPQGGNTKPPAGKQDSACIKWCFTLNNYTDNNISTVINYFNSLPKTIYIIGKEVGEQGTPHLQGYVELGKRKRFTELSKLNPKIHWEKAKGTKSQNIDYCSKEGNIITNIRLPRKQTFPTFNKPWQLQILNLIKEIPNDRTIHWFWERKGGIGKTTFCKYLDIHHHATCVPSKTNDAFHMIAKEIEAGNPIDLVIFDIPRTSLDFINYAAIEAIKNGFLISGKYEGLKCNFASPHVIVFANEPPKKSAISEDRWNIIDLNEPNDST